MSGAKVYRVTWVDEKGQCGTTVSGRPYAEARDLYQELSPKCLFVVVLSLPDDLVVLCSREGWSA